MWQKVPKLEVEQDNRLRFQTICFHSKEAQPPDYNRQAVQTLAEKQ